MKEMTAGDIMSRHLELRNEMESVARAARALRPESSILVVDQWKGSPLGMFGPGLRDLGHPDPSSPLREYLSADRLPAIITPETSLDTVLHGMSESPLIRWHLVSEGDHIIGYIGPHNPGLIEYGLALAELDVTALSAFGVGPILDRLRGRYISPVVPYCYCCRRHTPAHCVSRSDGEKRARDHVKGQVYCDGDELMYPSPCPLGFTS